ncbi:MAG: ATP-binding domain-containing protein [Pleurocapsa minor HA4230-MV1]|jgi:ATP-dependent exoDNAse (exonuclease V) alpha subunit|nr:ATP-binding domain-containing protein [Pleurocapsa minor HA4230-MV1]
MIFLSGHGVSTTYAVKIYKQYGDSAIATVTTNPYQLAIDIFGIGFLTADKIAVNVGVSPWSKFRYRAGYMEKEVTIDFDGRDVVYDYADLNEITLAWATSIHKSQGSEYPVVILPL